MRNLSGASPVFEPLLYSGERGNWVRERIRLAAKRVFEAGGSIQNAADAAIKEMHQHVQFHSPSAERIDEINQERLEVVVWATGGPPEATDPLTLAQTCPDVCPF